MEFNKAKEFITRKLKSELDPRLTYHSYEHTMDVLNACKWLAREEKVSSTELVLLKTAALYHDLGFTRKYDGHEGLSARFAFETLPHFDYTDNEVEIVCNMILSTRVPQDPQTLLEKILVDADMDYLGRKDYEKISESLYTELKNFGKIDSLRHWYEMQYAFISRHRYFTASAQKLRDVKKMENLGHLLSLLKDYEEVTGS